ncbi:MAG TPA: hypothetical protein VEB18_04310 [Candidatus Paceibacterota bacterium]|nr:hypothetical protein [Candidatus Paceibacterota bacterium]
MPRKAATTPKQAVQVLVVSGDPAAIRKALRARGTKTDVDPERVKNALKLYDMVEKFFALGGRFKKPYTRGQRGKAKSAKRPVNGRRRPKKGA